MKGVAKLAVNLKQYLPHPNPHPARQHYEDAVPLDAASRPYPSADHQPWASHGSQPRDGPTAHGGPRPPSGRGAGGSGVPSISSITHFPLLPSQRGDQPPSITQPSQPDGPASVHCVATQQAPVFREGAYLPPGVGQFQDRGDVHGQEPPGIPTPFLSRPLPHPFQSQWYPAAPISYPPPSYSLPPRPFQTVAAPAPPPPFPQQPVS
ncbi:hypothetical protein ACOMHN_065085 [Nucella lapillus]